MYTREELVNLLKENVIQVLFIKRDGTERLMFATLMETRIPSRKLSETTPRHYSEENIRVFDIEKQEFRAFRIDSIKEIISNG